MKWIDINDRLPKYHQKVLVYYEKGKGRNTDKQSVIIQGYFCDYPQDIADGHKDTKQSNGVERRSFWSEHYGFTWFDYAERQIQDLSAKTSKNKVTHWMPLPEPPKK